MSIQINKPILLNNNILFDSCYVRLNIKFKHNGKEIDIDGLFYQNKDFFKKDIYYESNLHPIFNKKIIINCDNNINNYLEFSHNKYIEYLTNDLFENIKIKLNNIDNIDLLKIIKNDDKYSLIDNNNNIYFTTSNEIINNNNIFYEKFLVREKYFESSDVVIVDLD